MGVIREDQSCPQHPCPEVSIRANPGAFSVNRGNLWVDVFQPGLIAAWG